MDWKKLGRKLLFPPAWLILILAVFITAALVAVFLKGREQTAVAYAVYVLAFYTLTVTVCFCITVLPKMYGQIKKRIYDNPFSNRYLTDKVFRTKLSLYTSLAASLLYVGINLWSWYLSRSRWFLVLAVYDGIMGIMRFLLVRYVRKSGIGTRTQLRIYPAADQLIPKRCCVDDSVSKPGL